MHEASVRQHPLLADYGVALAWPDLGYLVLSDLASERTALACAAYLRCCSKPSREVFSLCDGRGAATWDLAVDFARSSDGLQTIWSNEQKAARIRKSKHWDEVTRKQRAAAACRAELDVLRDKQRVAQSEYDAAQSSYERSYSKESGCKLQSCRDRFNSVSSMIAKKEGELRNILAAPQPVFQPLPNEEDNAFKWLFWLHMKTCAPHLQRLARMSYLAQQVLLSPCEPSLKQKLSVRLAATLCLGDLHGHTLLLHVPFDEADCFVPSGETAQDNRCPVL